MGEKLKEFRIRKGYTQENVAELLEMSLTNYANIEQGKTKVNLDKLAKIAEKLDTNIFELLALGEKNVYYIHNDKQQGGQSENGYIIHNDLPENYQTLALENAHLKEKNALLEKRITDLEEMNEMLKQNGGTQK